MLPVKNVILGRVIVGGFLRLVGKCWCCVCTFLEKMNEFWGMKLGEGLEGVLWLDLYRF